MGFEIVYSYHERDEDGVYNMEETKTIKRRIGNAHDDVPLEKAARAILLQLARREILVVDVEVFEFAKKKLNYRESNGGIVIKNQRFNLDQGDFDSQPAPSLIPQRTQPILSDDEYDEEVEYLPDDEMPLPLLRGGPSTMPVFEYEPPRQMPQRRTHVDQNEMRAAGGNINFADIAYFKSKHPIRQEVYAPRDKMVAFAAKARNLAFTLGKKYPIYEEKPAGGDITSGMVYVTRDDNGNKQIIHDRHFDTPAQLLGGDQFNDDYDYGTSSPADNQMPSLR